MLDMSSLTNTVKKSSHNESQTDTLTERQSSLMCVSSSSPVQPSSIEELRMWLVEAFPASPSQSQDQEKPKMTPEICGPQQPTLFASSDLPAFSWKMCRDYLASTTQKAYSLTLPKWGMWDATGLYPLPMLVQGTGGNGSGLYVSWPTPKTQDERGALTDRKKSNLAEEVHEISMTDDGARLSPEWTEWLMGWPLHWTNVQPLPLIDWRDWSVDPADIGEVPRVSDVKENRSNRIKALGNGQVPQCVVKAWELLA